MRTCANCRQQSPDDKKFCPRCGTPLLDTRAGPPTDPSFPVIRNSGTSPLLPVLIAIACVVVLAGAGVGTWVLVAHPGKHSPVPLSHTAPVALPTTAPPITPPSPAAASTAPAAPPGPVSISSAAQDNGQAQAAAEFLDQYFNAINNHDYGSYSALLTPDQQGSQSSFENGYSTTQDSDETLENLSSGGPGGDYVAEVSFTSNQDPSQSVDGAGCNDWDLNLYLMPEGNGSFLIDKPPSGYHAHYTDC